MVVEFGNLCEPILIAIFRQSLNKIKLNYHTSNPTHVYFLNYQVTCFQFPSTKSCHQNVLLQSVEIYLGVKELILFYIVEKKNVGRLDNRDYVLFWSIESSEAWQHFFFLIYKIKWDLATFLFLIYRINWDLATFFWYTKWSETWQTVMLNLHPTFFPCVTHISHLYSKYVSCTHFLLDSHFFLHSHFISR